MLSAHGRLKFEIPCSIYDPFGFIYVSKYVTLIASQTLVGPACVD
jgi:hypothetical protein